MVISKKFWKGKKVLITGHTGFKGSWLSIILNKLNVDLYGISLRPKKNSLFKVLKINKIYKKNFYTNIKNFKKINKIIQKINPDIIIHMAAQPIVRLSYDDPYETYYTNVIGTMNILETVRQNNLKTFSLIVTTDKVYRPNNQNIYKESDALGGIDPYSSSKSCVEHLSLSYSKILNKKCKIVTVRAGNVIGGGDWSEDRIIPDIVRHIFEKRKLIIRNLESIRPWQHVLDPLKGYLISIEKNYYKVGNYNVYNFGPKNENQKKVLNIINYVNKNYQKINYQKINKKEFSEEKVLKLQNKFSKKNLNWYPKLNFSNSLMLTLDWYYEFYRNKKNIFEFTNKQVSNFFNF